jgi:microcystin degradation protein MlrC
MKTEILQRLADADRLDAICIVLHGAMVVDGVECAETDLLNSIRKIVGDEIPIAASLDLHGNISGKLADSANILTAYRTAPHTDRIQTERKAAQLLVKAVMRKLKPQSQIVRPPVLLPGELVVTTADPAASLYRILDEIDAQEGIMDSSLLVGMAWADVPQAGASAIVVTTSETCLAKAHQSACSLAKTYWLTRNEFKLEVEAYSAEDAVKQAQATEKKPVFISDSGDNVTAGAPGDIPIMIEHLLANRAIKTVVGGIRDTAAVEVCKHAGVGTTLRLEIGGKHDQVHGYPLEVRGRVLNCTKTGAVFQVNGVKIIVTETTPRFTSPTDFQRFGIEPSMHEVVIVKQGYLFPKLRKIAAKAIIALTPGCTDLAIERLEYQNIVRPMFPIDTRFSWNP